MVGLEADSVPPDGQERHHWRYVAGKLFSQRTLSRDADHPDAEYNCRKFKPRESVIKAMTEKGLKNAIAAADAMFA